MRKSKKGLLQRCSSFAIRRPWPVLAAWIVVVAVLAVFGSQVKSVIVNDELVIEGTESSKALKQEHSKFGKAETIAVMLKGPPAALRRYGPKVAREIEKLDRVSVTSPWSPDAPKALQRKPGSALLLLQVRKPLYQAGKETTPQVHAVIERVLPKSIEANVTGMPVIGARIKDVVVKASDRAELIAAPVLLVVLLLIFRSPVAAALPLVLGLSVITSGSGIISLLGRGINIDEIGLTLMIMIGLALGVDYSLLIVSRFREELGRHDSTKSAASAAVATAGRTVVVAGSIVVIGLGVTTLMAPGGLLVSGAIGVVTAAVLSMAAATTLLPALLSLIGPRVNKWHIGRRGHSSRLAPLVSRLIRRPGIATVVVLALLLTLTVPALGLNTGPPDVRFLPPDDPTLADTQKVADSYGAGTAAPYVVMATSKDGPITTPGKMAALQRFQRQVASDPMVENVIGPATVAKGTKRISRAVKSGDSDLKRLDSGLGLAYTGTSKLKRGLASAAKGSAQLASGASEGLFGTNRLIAGIGEAQAGIASLEGGLAKTQSGSQSLEGALYSLKSGTAELRSAAYEASQGAQSLQGPAGAFKQEMSKSTSDLSSLKGPPDDALAAIGQAKAALDAAPLAVKQDPGYQAAYQELLTAEATLTGYDPLSSTQQLQSGYYGMSQAIDRAVASSQLAAGEASELAGGADELAAGLDSLAVKNSELYASTDETRAGAGSLNLALDKAALATSKLNASTGASSAAAASLEQGTAGFKQGSQALATGLKSSYGKSATLAGGLKEMKADVSQSRKSMAQGSGEIDQEKVANSGYLTLAALEGAGAAERRNANLVVNASRGGDSARVFVMIDRNINERGVPAFTRRLKRQAAALGSELGATTIVGGRAASLNDFDRETDARQIPAIVVLSVISLLFLIATFRSILMAFKAVVLNLLTVGAAFGVIALLFNGSPAPMGGPGWVNVVVFFGVYAIVFTLSMDYEIFLINRMREGYRHTGSNEKAIQEGIAKTAGVITGAAVTMAAVFLAFASSDIGTLQQFGLALTTAVLIDATVVRLVLLPATMRLFGRANWWLPKWLDRRLPNLDMEVQSAKA